MLVTPFADQLLFDERSLATVVDGQVSFNASSK